MASNKSSEYIKVDQPLFLRRKLLETAVDSTEILRFFENYKLIKEKKVFQINKLKTLMIKIKREIIKLNKELPESKKENIPKNKPNKKKQPEQTKKVKSLDEELVRIKEKLSNLSI